MNYIFCIVFLFFSFLSFSQEWEKQIKDARKLYQNKKYTESSKVYSNIEKKAPNTNDFKQEIAQNAYRSEKFDVAEKKYSSSVNLAKTKEQKALSYYNLGNTYLKQQKLSEAIEAYKQSLRLNSKDEECRFNLAKAMIKQQNNSSSPNKNNQSKQEKNNKINEKENSSEKNNEQKKVDRMLDELRKKEAETKKKSSQNRKESSGNEKTNKHVKDW
ncbi:MAG: tetratricopeptide repeat protein [Flavobacteriia bacterium]|nr:tetratricopeptide repeat protein [Flavobacteriia bacterium]